MPEKKKDEKLRVEFRYYVLPENEEVLALLGNDWKKEYGEGLERLHFHNYLETGICRKGSGKVVIDRQILDFHPGNIMIIPPNVLHTTNTEGGEEAFWEWFYFDIEAVVNKMFDSENDVTRKNFLDKIYRIPFFVDSEDYPVLAGIIELIIREITGKGQLYRKSIHNLLSLFVVEVLRMQETSKDIPCTENSLNRIAPAIEYTRIHFQETIRMVDMASVCGMSESHFRKEFLESMNMRPSDYVNLIRVEKACNIMKRSPISMEDVAFRCGFGNVSTLTRNFKKVMGVTPYQWKKSSDNYEIRLREYKISAHKGW